jgi:hypothetical protein
VLTVTARLWHRGGRLRLLLRPVAVLLSQALILVTVGLAVNRSQGFYPSWASLAGHQQAETVASAAPDGRLDDAVRARLPLGAASAVTVSWHPGDVAGWHLTATPTVTVPPDYLSRSADAFPAVLSIVAPATVAPSPVPVRRAGAPVLVTAPASARTTPAHVAAALPDQLGRDLRVASHGCTLVAGRHQAALASRAVQLVPGRFTALVLGAGAGTGPLPVGVRLPVGLPVAVVGLPASGVPAGVTALRCRAGDEWATAVAWAVRQAPPVLAPAVVLPPLPAR